MGRRFKCKTCDNKIHRQEHTIKLMDLGLREAFKNLTPKPREVKGKITKTTSS